MSEHAIEVVSEYGELSLKLVCHAVPGSPCRMRPPAGDDREYWHIDDPGLVAGECWAVEWQRDAGFVNGVRSAEPGTVADPIVWASIPVGVEYDECVIVARIPEHTTLPVPESSDSTRSCRVCGCTDDDCSGCIARTGQPCGWVAGEADLCTACVDSSDSERQS